MVYKITDENFQSKVLDNKNIAVVIFSEKWNAGSDFLERHLNDLDSTFDDRISVFKIDVDQNKKIIENFMIYEYPATLIFKAGELVEIFSGLYSRKKILGIIENHLNN